MPTSDPRTISQVHRMIAAIRPGSIIDIGVGHGKTAVIAREYLEMWDREAYRPEQWQTRIYGIEVFADYRNPLWDYAYNEVVICDALEGLDRLPKVDLILALDVWEHFEPDYASRVLERCLARASFLLISTPIKPARQPAVYGNPREAHVSRWTPGDFSGIAFRAALSNGKDWCLLLSASTAIPRNVRRLCQLRSQGWLVWRILRHAWRWRKWQSFGGE